MSRPARGACDTRAAAELFRTLAHPMRLTILCRLSDGELSVSGMESQLGLKQPSLSQQLGILREAGLVTTRREAKSVFYSLADRRLRAIIDALRDAMSTTPQLNVPVRDARTDKPAGLLSRHAGAEASSTSGKRMTGAVECGVFAVVG